MEGTITPQKIAKMRIRDLLDLNPAVRRYLLSRIPDV